MKKSIIIAIAILCHGCLTSCSVSKLSLNEDGIPFITDSPTESFLSDWSKHNSLKCRKLIQGKTEGYAVPSVMIENDPCLVYLILKSKTILQEDNKVQDWFDMYSIMNKDQIYRLYNILYREKAKEKGGEINQTAYDYAKQNNYKKAIETINMAIAMYPNEANYYDSKGEFLLKIGDKYGALKMWQKTIEVDPDFLSKYNSTILYEGLKTLELLK